MNALPEQDQVLIDKYLRNELSAAEVQEIQTRRTADPQFARHLAEMEALQQAAKAEGRNNLRKKFRQWDRAGKRQIFTIRRIAAAAAVAGLLVLAYFVIPREQTPPSLASAYLAPYPNVVAPLQKSDSDPSTYEKAFQLYEAGEYKQAEAIFATLDQNNESVQFYRAVNHLLAGNDRQAVDALQMMIADPQHAYFQPALWYLALGQVNLGMRDQARITLRNVVSAGPPYADQAIELMNAL